MAFFWGQDVAKTIWWPCAVWTAGELTVLPRLPRGLCYVDYKNAFDRLMHNELLEVIKRTGIPVLEQDIHVASDVSPWPWSL